ncbi:hypothetical protein AVEN_103362-1 [Araneus ventricosus]|uniref:Transposable element Tc3 transposase n=1 Tax=Araneus ventricosus TaxID=182803 RepID=A0A4Y2P7I7_ARAVE|nr:hypothetical protein AVEN_103362-1 [Araneus ventricosus]
MTLNPIYKTERLSSDLFPSTNGTLMVQSINSDGIGIKNNFRVVMMASIRDANDLIKSEVYPGFNNERSVNFANEDLALIDLRNVWLQHDGAPPHTVSSVQQYIRDTFQQQVIGYGGCVEWPPSSPDLNPLDFFMWGYIKQQMYATPPPTLQELRNRITDACASVSPAMLYDVQREVQSRVQMCIVAEGHHFEHDR